MNPIAILNTKLPVDMPEDAKAWVFQSSRNFQEHELLEIKEQLDHFTLQWESHGVPVKGFGDIFFDNTVILVANEPISGVSGCSTDGMMRVIKSIERQYNTSMFDRLTLMFYTSKGKYERLPLHQVEYALEKKYITLDTLYFNVGVHTYSQLKSEYIIPLKESWIAQHLASSYG